jgi:hypothetical protein
VGDFKYFAAPRSEMAGLLAGDRQCSLCGTAGPCFSLERTLQPEAGAGCFDCLQAGRFGFSHITEVGYLERNGLVSAYDDEPDEPRRLFVVGVGGEAEVVSGAAAPVPGPAVPPAQALEELRRTPDFPTWNEVEWLVHCADFMVYLGPWQPSGVRAAAAAQGVVAADLLHDMAGAYAKLPSDPRQETWGLTFHVFRCGHCSLLRGWPDPD